MADFNLTVGPPTQVMDQTRASEGYRDDALGGLFSNISESFQVGLRATDDFLKRRVGDEARAMVEPLRDDMIANLAAYQGGDPTAGLPPEAGQEFERLAKYKTGVKVGRLSDSYYRSQLDVVSKKLRRSYPGYEDEIDNRLQELTGSIPANKLLADLQAEASAINSSKTSNKSFDLYSRMVQDGNIDPQAMPFEAFGNDPQKILNAASPKIRQRTELNDSKLRISEAQAAGELDKTLATKEAESASQNILRGVLNDTSNKLGKTRQELVDSINRMDPKKPWSAEEVANLEMGGKQFEAGVRTELNKYYNEPNENGVTISSVIGQETVNKIVEARVAEATSFMSAIRDKNTGAIIHNESLNRIFKEEGAVGVNNDPGLRYGAAISREMGQEFGRIWMGQNPELIGRAARGLNNVTGAIITGEAPSLKAAWSAQDFSKMTDKEKAQMGEEVYKKLNQLISDPNTPAIAKANLIRATYGDGNVGFVTRSPENFSKLTDMKTLQEVKKFADASGQPELWNNAYNWTLKTGSLLLRNQAISMQGMHTSDRFGITSYDPSIGQFAYAPTRNNLAPDAGQSGVNVAIDSFVGQYITSPIAATAVKNANISIANMRKVFEVADPKTALENTNKWVQGLTNELGATLSQSKDPNTGVQGFFSSMKEAVDKYLPANSIPLVEFDNAGRVQLNITTDANGALVRRNTPNRNTARESRMNLGGNFGRPIEENFLGQDQGDVNLFNQMLTEGPEGTPRFTPQGQMDARTGLTKEIGELQKLYEAATDPEMKAHWREELLDRRDELVSMRRPAKKEPK